MMKTFLAALLLLFAGLAQAQTNLAWVPNATVNRDSGAWRLVTDTTLVICRTVSTQTYSSAPIRAFSACTTEVYACTTPKTVGQTDGCPSGSNYSAERFIPRATVAGAGPPPPPTCTAPKPPDVVRAGECPVGTVGQWQQTSTYSAAPFPTCWVQGPFLPADPPPDTCLPIGPPGRITRLSVVITNDVCQVGMTVMGAPPFRIEGQKSGTTEWISSAVDVPYLTCEQLGIETGIASLVNFRACNVGGCGPGTGHWPVLRFNPQNLEDEQVELNYVIVKNSADGFAGP